MRFLISVIILLILELLYFRIADHFNIIDKPNERSSHTKVTIRGGGIIFPFAIILFSLFNQFQYPWFTSGLLLIALISFLDDILTLSNKLRISVHLVSVALLLFELNLYSFHILMWPIFFILIIGWINAFNFMDGINGITAFYSLSVLAPVAYLNYLDPFISWDLLLILSFSIVIFAFFNARKKAMAFAGDIGSVSMAFIITFLMISLFKHDGSVKYIAFVSVYGVDTILTIVHRLMNKENIFKAHRSHLYQYLANEMKWGHIPVSTLYALIQLIISFTLILWPSEIFPNSILSVILILACGLAYIFSKSYILKSLTHQN